MFDDSFPDDSFPDDLVTPHPRHEVIGELRRRVAAVTSARNSPVARPLRPSPELVSPALAPVPDVSEVTAGRAGEGAIPVPAPLAAVLPRHGLARGSVVSLLGQGATSLLFALLSGSTSSWSALVGMPDIGLLAASEFGIDLDRVVLVPDPGPDVLQVISILFDGVDMVAVTLPDRVRPGSGRLRILAGRLRQRGAVLLTLGAWPGADLVLTARWQGWSGLGQGHGRLRDRELVVNVSGRGAVAGRGRQAALLLHGQRAAVQIAGAQIAGAPIAGAQFPAAGAEPRLFPAVAEVG